MLVVFMAALVSGQERNATHGARKGNNWQRMKECAEQTEKMAIRAGWKDGQRTGDFTNLGWDNHYSPKYERCYIRVTYMRDAVLEEVRDLLPLFYDELYDAFEGKLIATCTDTPAPKGEASLFCRIEHDESTWGKCQRVRQFIKDRMTN